VRNYRDGAHFGILGTDSQYVIAYTDSAEARKALGALGSTFRMRIPEGRAAGQWQKRSRLFVASFKVGKADDVDWLDERRDAGDGLVTAALQKRIPLVKTSEERRSSSERLLCPYCGKVEPSGLNRTKCAECGQHFVPGDVERAVSVHAATEEFDANLAKALALANPPSGTKQYKVLTQRDEFFRSKFNPENLQQLINVHAIEGWRVVSMTATDVGSFLGSFWQKGGGASRQELIVLLERTVP
jgi:hypothetical protein